MPIEIKTKKSTNHRFRNKKNKEITKRFQVQNSYTPKKD